MATQLFPTTSGNFGVGGTGARLLKLTRGSSSTSAITTTTAGGTNIPVTTSAGGTALTWWYRVGAQTISGNVTANIRGLESVATANAGVGILIERYDPTGTTLLGTILSDRTIPATITEFTTTDAAKALASVAVTSTATNNGDWIKVTLKIRNVGTMAAGTATISYNGPTASAAGDSYITFANTISPYIGSFGTHWINRVTIAAPRNGTSVQSVDPAAGIGGSLVDGNYFSPTAGNLLVIFYDTLGSIGAVTGYTLPSHGSWFNNTATYVRYKTAAGDDQAVFNISGSNYPLVVTFLEFPAGTTLDAAESSGDQPSDGGGVNNILTGLTTSNLILRSVAKIETSTNPATHAWTWSTTNPLVDTFTPAGATNGYHYGISYDKSFSGSTANYEGSTAIGGTPATTERLTVAFTTPSKFMPVDPASTTVTATITASGVIEAPYLASNSGYGYTTTGTTVDIPVTSGVTAGSLILLPMWTERTSSVTPFSASILTPPAGFSLAGQYGAATSGTSYGVFSWWFKYATGADTGTYTFGFSSLSGTVACGGFSERILYGPSAGYPFVDGFFGNLNPSSNTVSLTTVTTTEDKSLLLSLFWGGSGGTTLPPGWRLDGANNTSDSKRLLISSVDAPTAGSLGTLNFTAGTGTRAGVTVVAIRPSKFSTPNVYSDATQSVTATVTAAGSVNTPSIASIGSQGHANTGTTVGIPVPSGVISGSLVVVGLWTERTANITSFSASRITPPTGFILGAQYGGAFASSYGVLSLWFKYATGSDSGSYTFEYAGISGTVRSGGYAQRVISGPVSGYPFSVYPADNTIDTPQGIINPSGKNASIGSFSTGDDHSLVIAFARGGTDAYSFPAGWTIDAQALNSDNDTLAVGHFAVDSASSLGSLSFYSPAGPYSSALVGTIRPQKLSSSNGSRDSSSSITATTTASGVKGTTTTTTLSATASITASGSSVQDYSGISSLAETASITAAGAKGSSNTSSRPTVATITVVGSKVVSNTSSRPTTATITSAGSRNVSNTASRTVTATVTAVGSVVRTATASLEVWADTFVDGDRNTPYTLPVLLQSAKFEQLNPTEAMYITMPNTFTPGSTLIAFVSEDQGTDTSGRYSSVGSDKGYSLHNVALKTTDEFSVHGLTVLSMWWGRNEETIDSWYVASSASPFKRTFILMEWSGLKNDYPWSVEWYTPGSIIDGDWIEDGTFPIQNDANLLVSGIVSTDDIASAGAGLTLVQSTTTYGNSAVEYKIRNSPGDITPDWHLASPSATSIVMSMSMRNIESTVTPEPLAAWRMSEGPGASSLLDSKNSAFNIPLSNPSNVLWDDNGSGYLEFSANTSDATLNISSLSLGDATNNLTFTCKYRYDGPIFADTSTDYLSLIGGIFQSIGNASAAGWSYRNIGSSSSPNVLIRGGTEGSSYENLGVGSTHNDNGYHSLAITYAADGTVTLYKDSVLIATGSRGAGIGSSYLNYISFSDVFAQAGNDYPTYVTDARLFDTILPAWQIYELPQVVGPPQGTSTVSVSATIAAAGTVTVGFSGTSSRPVTATISSVGSRGVSNTTTRPTTATITSAGSTGRSSTATNSTVAAITTAGSKGSSTTASVPVSATITSAGLVTKNGAASLSVAATISTAGVVNRFAISTLSVSASILTAGSIAASSTAAVSAVATISANGAKNLYHLFSNDTPSTTGFYDVGSVNLGVEFFPNSACWVTKIGYWQVDDPFDASARTVGLYEAISSSAGTLLASATGPISTSGWVWITLTTPVQLKAGKAYRAVTFHPVSKYPAASHYFDGGAYSGGGANVTVGPVVIPGASNAYGGAQGSFIYSGSLAYTTGSFNSANYWTDIEFTTVDPAGSTEGNSALISTASITAAGRRDYAASSSLTATATITSAGVVGKVSTATISPVATIASVGSRGISAIASVSNTAIISAVGTVDISSGANASLVATASIAASALMASTATSALTVTTASVASGQVGKNSGATRSITATTSATGRTGRLSGASVAVSATISAAGQVARASGASLTVAWTPTISGSTGGSGVNAFIVTDTDIVASGQLGKIGTTTRPITATITTAGQANISGTTSRSVNASISATGLASGGTGSSLIITSNITAVGMVGKSATAARTTSATITSAGFRGIQQNAAALVTANIAANGFVSVSSGASLEIEFDSTINGAVNLSGTASVNFSASITASGAMGARIFVALTDQIGISDSLDRYRIWPRSVNESIAVVDNLISVYSPGGRTITVHLSELIGVTDQLNTHQKWVRSVNETISVTDPLVVDYKVNGMGWTFRRDINNTVKIRDGLDRPQGGRYWTGNWTLHPRYVFHNGQWVNV